MHKEFLQSDEWRKFQESVGRKTYCITSENFSASIIEHKLPIVGKYLYVPRGPICHSERGMAESKDLIKSLGKLKMTSIKAGMIKLLDLVKKEKAGWIRIEPENNDILEMIRNVTERGKTKLRIMKAPHDMQPKKVLVIDISKPEEELLAEMKQKTRYNIKLSRKRGVSVKIISNFQFTISQPKVNLPLADNQIPNFNDQNPKFYIDEFIKLVKTTAVRDKITPHPENYYRQMFKTIPGNILKLYAAEYEGKIIAANVVIFYANTATYLHGASDNEHRDVMAPYLLQWQAILDAKKAGLARYDLGGVETINQKSKIKNQNDNGKFKKNIHNTIYMIKNTNSWQGITRFKTGFSPETKLIAFPGSYDIIVDKRKYYLYRIVQKIKR